jgi:hypothetical protein
MEETTEPNNTEPIKKTRQQRYRERHPERIKEQERWRNQRRATYQRQWQAAHPAQVRASKQAYREQTREKEREHSYSKRVRNRLEVLHALGGKCVRCGIDDWRVLQIDHINGGGTQERQHVTSITRYYKDMLLSPEKYQVLCANCHQIKRYEEREGRI